MKWLAAIVFFFLLATTAPANPPGKDYSDPELVNMYIWLACDALEYSYTAMRADLNTLSKRYIKCIAIQDNDDLKNHWYGLTCVFHKQTFDFRYTHIKSVEKAWNLMCNDDGQKEEQYEIDF